MPSIIRNLTSSIHSSPQSSPQHAPMPDYPPLFDASHVKSRKRFSHHRASIDYSKSNKSSSDSLVGEQRAALKVVIESPPLVCYGEPATSSGALMSGQLYLEVGSKPIMFQKLEMSLKLVTHTRKPVVPGCQECSTQTEEIQNWTFIREETKARAGEHQYPFSYLIPGHLPASTSSALGSIKYELRVVGIKAGGELLQHTHGITISRAILPGADRHSLRIFPPTDLTAALILPPVIHKGGEFPIEMKMKGINNIEKGTRWKLRKVVWRIDETSEIVSPPCPAHVGKVGGEGKGMKYEDLRTLGVAELKTGWKTDNSETGQVDFEFMAGIPAGFVGSNDVESTKPGCLTVAHNLVIEMVVSEEYIPKNTKLATPTGAARVLRMQFKMVCTERGGQGISWEEECPPLYENVPQSPPEYGAANESCSDHESLDNFRI